MISLSYLDVTQSRDYPTRFAQILFLQSEWKILKISEWKILKT